MLFERSPSVSQAPCLCLLRTTTAHVLSAEVLVPDSEAVIDFIRRMGEAKPKFAFLMRDSKDFLFLKEKVYGAAFIASPLTLSTQNVSIDAAIPPTSKTPPKDAQGWLRKKKEGKQWKKRWVKLVGNTLHYQKDPRVRAP